MSPQRVASSFVLCMRVYDRAGFLGDVRYTELACHFRHGHLGGCSWQDVWDEDRAIVTADAQAIAAAAVAAAVPEPPTFRPDTAEAPPERGAAAPSAEGNEAIVLDFCESIEAGDFDEWLELILSTGHARKLTRRGVRGFPRRRRSDR